MLLNSLFCRSVTNSVYKLRNVYQSLAKNTKYINSASPTSKFHSSTKCTYKLKNPRYSKVTDLNTNVHNNVILYKNENYKDFRILRIVLYGWLCCNTFMLVCCYDPKYFTTWHTYETWMDYLKNNGTNILYFAYALIIGPLACAILFILNQRCIRYIVLHKGGKDVSIITNHWLKDCCSYISPVESVKIRLAREASKHYIPVKLKDYRFYFLLDNNGKILNEKLFDYTIGKAKNW